MIPTGKDINVILIDLIDQAVYIVDPTAPASRKVTDKRLRLSDAGISVAFDIVDKKIDTFQSLAILGLPIDIIRPTVIGK